MSAEVWSPEFQRLILAAALRGSLPNKITLDPALFGLKTPRRRLADLIVKRPALAEFSQMVKELGETISPEERGLLQSEADAVLTTNPNVSAYTVEQIRERMEFQALEQGLLQLDEVLTQGPAALKKAREVLTRAMQPIPVNGDDLTRGSDLTMRAVRWLWANRIPKGAMTLITGDPARNKTTVALDLGARQTQGKPWPDGAPGTPETIIVLSNEDDVESVLLPRFVAMGGDRDRVYFLRSEIGTPLLSLQNDVARLEGMIRETGATTIIIDPVNAYLPKVNTWKDSDIREALTPLAILAQRLDVTLFGIMHLNKKSDYSTMQRVMGGIGFVAMARAAYLLVDDPNDSNRRLFLNFKMSVGATPTGLAFRLVPTMIRATDGSPIQTLRIAWDSEPVTLTADEALRPPKPPGKEEQGETLIRELLADGPVLAATMVSELEASGMAARTIKRSKEAANVGSVKDPRINGAWYWTPPGWTSAQRQAWLDERRGEGS